MAGYRVRCTCCGNDVHRPVWDIVPPATGRSVAVCCACSGHVALKADGTLWTPGECPAAVPRPRFRILHPDDDGE